MGILALGILLLWWDILAFGATYAFEQRARRPMFMPLISARF